MLLKNQNTKVQTSLAENCQKVKTDNFHIPYKNIRNMHNMQIQT